MTPLRLALLLWVLFALCIVYTFTYDASWLVITEDSPLWNCQTMGNQECGP